MRQARRDLKVRPVGKRKGVAAVLMAGLKLVFPVLLLLFVLDLCFELRNAPAAFLDGLYGGAAGAPLSAWMSWGHVLLPLAFFVTALTNRAMGPDMASFQVLGALAVSGAVAAAAPYMGMTLPAEVANPGRETFAFVAAAVVALLFAIGVFDAKRGIHGWQAPLYGGIAFSLFFVLIFYPGAYLGTEEPWGARMLADFGVKLAVSVLLVAPFYLLRPLIRPAAGYPRG